MRAIPSSTFSIGLLIFLAACADQRESAVRQDLQQRIATQSDGAFLLSGFDKTNGYEQGFGGVAYYTLEWQARLSVQGDVWKPGDQFSRWADFRVTRTELLGWEALVAGGGGYELIEGATVVLTGESHLQKTENGWRVVGSQVKTVQVLDNERSLAALADIQGQQEDARLTPRERQAAAERRGEASLLLTVEIDQPNGNGALPEPLFREISNVLEERLGYLGASVNITRTEIQNQMIVEVFNVHDVERVSGMVTAIGHLDFRITDRQGRFRDIIPQMDAVVGVSDSPDSPGGVSRFLYNGQLPGEYLVAEEDAYLVDSLVRIRRVQRLIPTGLQLFWGRETFSVGTQSFRGLYALGEPEAIGGDYLINPEAFSDPLSSRSGLTLQWTRMGQRLFARLTAGHIGDYLAILLDGQVAGRPLVISPAIHDSLVQVDLGDVPLEEARDLAAVIGAGRLPGTIRIIDSTGPVEQR